MQRDDSESEHDSVIAPIIRAVTHFVSRRPATILFLTFLAVVGSIGYTAFSLRFKTDRSDLIDPRADYQRRWLEYTREFGDAADMVVVVEADNAELIKKTLDDLGARMEAEPEHFMNVLYRVDTTTLRQKGLQYLSPAQLEDLLGRLEEFGPVLKGQWNLFNLKTLYQGLRFQVEQTAAAPAPAVAAEPLLQLAGGLSESLLRFTETREYNSPWQDFVTLNSTQREEASQVRYFLNEKGTFGFILSQPKVSSVGFNGANGAIDRVRKLMAETQVRFPETRLGLTGIPVLESDEMRSSQSAMFLASIISFTGVGLLLMIGFRGFRHPALAMTMLAAGMAWSFGFTTFAVGHLNILSVSFITILVGLGIDFAILFLSRYLEVRHDEGLELQPALEKTAVEVGPGILTASITTALAFFCALFTDFLGVAELGIIAGGGILLCALAAFVVLPALISVADRNVSPQKLPTPFQGRLLRAATARYPMLIVFMSLILIAGVGINGFRVKYDYNLLNLQADGVESVAVQQRIVSESDTRLLFAVSVADSPEQALELKKKFEALPNVHHVDEIASYLPTYPADQTQLLVQGIRVMLEKLPADAPVLREVEPDVIGKKLEDFDRTIGSLDSPAAHRVHATVDRLLNQLDKLPLERQIELLTEYQARMRYDLLRRLQALASAAHSEPVTTADLPAGMASRFMSSQGRWLLQIYPNEEIWDIGPLTQFVSAIRSVDPNVTGTPLQNFEASRQIRDSYETVALYALLATFLVLLIDCLNFRDTLLALVGPLAGVAVMAVITRWMGIDLSFRHLVIAYVLMNVGLVALLDFPGLRDAGLALLPPLAGAGLMMGVLGLIHVDLNPANLIVLPLIIGIGVDNGVHVMHDYRLQAGRIYRPSPSTINAIILTSSTTMVGFGSMLVADHRGLWSLGVVLTVGVGSCLYVALIMLPSILTLISNGQRRDQDSAAGDQSGPAKEAEPTKRRVELSVFYPPESAA
jgi:hypothetical protein